MANYKLAAQKAFRYETVKGSVATEDLFDVSLRGNKGFNLGEIAKTIDANINKTETTSFVPDVAEKEDEANMIEVEKLEIVKDIIAQKLEEERKEKNAAQAKVKKAKLLEALAEKRDEALKNKSEDEILAELAALEA